MFRLQLVLPCYNESKSLDVLVQKTISTAIEFGFTSESFQLVLVENGSKDESLKEMQRLKSGDMGAWFHIVSVPINQGYGFGLWQGLKFCTAKYVAWTH